MGLEEDSEGERRSIWMLYYRADCSARAISSGAAALASLCIPIKSAFLAFCLMRESECFTVGPLVTAAIQNRGWNRS